MINHLGTVEIATNRLILRKHEITDADDMFKNWVADPEVSRYWGWKPHTDIEETKALLVKWIKEYENLDTYHWIIIFKSIIQAVGYIYLNDFDNTSDSASVRFALSRKYWNMGLTTEACKGVFNFAFTKLLCKEINSYHHIDNIASGEAMKKVVCAMLKLSIDILQIAKA